MGLPSSEAARPLLTIIHCTGAAQSSNANHPVRRPIALIPATSSPDNSTLRIGASVRILLYLNEHFLVGCLCEYVGVTLSVDRNDTPTQPYDRVSKQRLHAIAEFRVPAFLAQVLEEGINLEITDFQCAGPTLDQSHSPPLSYSLYDRNGCR